MIAPTIASRYCITKFKKTLSDIISEKQKKLLEKKEKEGLEPKKKTTRSNSKCQYKTLEEEQEERYQVIEEHLKIYQNVFPQLIEKFKNIDLGEATVPLAELEAHRVPEIPAKWVPVIEEVWTEEVAR